MISPHTWQKLKGLQGNTKYYQQLYVNKLGNLREMEKFLGKYKLSKLTPEKKKNMYTDLQINKYTYLKSSHKEKAQAHMASLMNCTKYLKKKNRIQTLSENRKDHYPTHSTRPILPG